MVTYMVMLPGGQYARGLGRSKYAGCPCRAPHVWDTYTQGVASLCPGLRACSPYRVFTLAGHERTGSLHQAKDIVVAPGEPFCTAIGSYFVFWGLRRSCKAGLGVAA